MEQNILIIGSRGFLGSHVKNLLEKQGKSFFEIRGKSEADITNLESFKGFVKGKNITSIINCAAYVGGISFGYKYQADLLKINSLMATNLYDVANFFGIKNIINPISNCAYPGNLSVYDEKDFWEGPPHESVFNYALSKRLFVALGKSFYEQYGISSYSVVLSNMYGPGDHFEEERSHALGALIKKIHVAKVANNDSVEVWGTGKPVREWLYVEDGAKALVKSLEIAEGNYLFNIGVNKGSTIIGIAELISKHMKWSGSFKLNADMPDGVLKKTVNGSLGSKLLDWSPEIKLNDGIKKTVEWYLNNNE
jgi:GDP-L-fucose synthase